MPGTLARAIQSARDFFLSRRPPARTLFPPGFRPASESTSAVVRFSPFQGTRKLKLPVREKTLAAPHPERTKVTLQNGSTTTTIATRSVRSRTRQNKKIAPAIQKTKPSNPNERHLPIANRSTGPETSPETRVHQWINNVFRRFPKYLSAAPSFFARFHLVAGWLLGVVVYLPAANSAQSSVSCSRVGETARSLPAAPLASQRRSQPM